MGGGGKGKGREMEKRDMEGEEIDGGKRSDSVGRTTPVAGMHQ
jgi:hypothetical protein